MVTNLVLSEKTIVSSSLPGTVFLVYWLSYSEDGTVHEGMAEDDCCLIGVYGNREKAEAAVTRAKQLPGFRDYPDSFLIEPYTLDEDNWDTGFYFGP